MKIIVDTNIIFSAIISYPSRLSNFLLNPSPHSLFSPSYLMEELKDKIPLLAEIKEVSEKEIKRAIQIFTSRIEIISDATIPLHTFLKALDFVKGVDSLDVNFVALALEMPETVILMRDKPLYEVLTLRGFNRVISTQELFKK